MDFCGSSKFHEEFLRCEAEWSLPGPGGDNRANGAWVYQRAIGDARGFCLGHGHLRHERDPQPGVDESLDGFDLHAATGDLGTEVASAAKGEHLVAQTMAFPHQNEAFVLQFREAHPLFTGQPMRGGHSQEQFLNEQSFFLEARIVDGEADDGEIEFAIATQLEQVRGGVFLDDDFYFWMDFAEGRDHIRQKIRRDGGQHSHRHASAQLSVAFTQFALRHLDLGEDALRARQEAFAGVGELGAARQAVEEAFAQLLLELLDLLAERGLGNVALLGGAREVARPGHGDDVTQLLEFHIF